MHLHLSAPAGAVRNRGPRPRFLTGPRDLANVNALELGLIVIIA